MNDDGLGLAFFVLKFWNLKSSLNNILFQYRNDQEKPSKITMPATVDEGSTKTLSTQQSVKQQHPLEENTEQLTPDSLEIKLKIESDEKVS